MADAPTVASVKIFLYILISTLLVPFAWCLCEHGKYKHGGIECCYCGPGQNVKEHCTVNGTSGKCVPCPSGQYKSVGSNSPCKECTSCEHENANLEEETPCKPAENRKCRCKKGYFCPSIVIACTVCLPCAECDHGVKVECSKHNDSVCKLETEGASNGGNTPVVILIVAIVILAAAAAAAVVVGVIWCTKCRGNNNVNNNEENEEGQPMRPIPDDIDPVRHVPALAEAIGWRDMRIVAMSSGIPNTTIENCETHGDLNERTIELLKIYRERIGRGWGERLRGSLIRNNRRSKAQQVESILLQGDGRRK